MTGHSEDWKEIGWNGICFAMPPSWEVGRIGRHYLLIEDGVQPVMELKWNRIKGSFSHRAHLKRLSRRQTRKPYRPFEVIETPDIWVEHLSSFDVRSFTWGDETFRGIGALLFCSECKNATLIQFFGPAADPVEGVSSRILESFRDHGTNGWNRWTIYDITAMVPDDFILDKYLFQPGRFELVFRGKGAKISLYRWGPASILLRDGGLETFVKKQFKMPPEIPLVFMEEDRAVFWSDRILGNVSRWTLARIRRKTGMNWLLFWEPFEKNRVLGITISGRKLPDTKVLNRMCADYVSF